MKFVTPLVFALLAANLVMGQIGQRDDDNWVSDAPIIVEAKVVAVVPVAARPLPDLPFEGADSCLFPHAQAKFEVFRVIQNLPNLSLAAGDTIAGLFVAGNVSTTPDAWGVTYAVNDHFLPSQLRPGLRGAFVFELRDGELWCSTRAEDPQKVMNALARIGRAGTESPVGGRDR